MTQKFTVNGRWYRLSGKLVGVYIDRASGDVTKIVKPHYDVPRLPNTEQHFAPHDDTAMIRVTLTMAEYSALPSAINYNGRAFYIDFYERFADRIACAEALTAKRICRRVAEVEGWLETNSRIVFDQIAA